MKIAAVMVTFNRINDLKKAIESYEKQTYLPYEMIIVNNASTDGTKEFLDEWKKLDAPFKKSILHLERNTGGSGGFYRGLELAQKTDADWYWIADDDAFLELTAFEKLRDFTKKYPEKTAEAAALCAAVEENEQNRKIISGHRRSNAVKRGIPSEKVIEEELYKNEYFNVDLFTFVGAFIKAEASKKAGLPQKDFFIYCDDLEYSWRVRKYGKIFCVTDSVVYHNAGNHEAEYGTTWRSYYQSRNRLLYYKWHFPRVYKRLVLKRYLQRVILKILNKYKPKNQLDFDAMMDAKKEKMGISEKYYIGWKL